VDARVKYLGGNNVQYLRKRLARLRPDLLERVDRGEQSMNSAAIEAGVLRRKVQIVPCPESIERVVREHLPGYRLVKEGA